MLSSSARKRRWRMSSIGTKGGHGKLKSSKSVSRSQKASLQFSVGRSPDFSKPESMLSELLRVRLSASLPCSSISQPSVKEQPIAVAASAILAVHPACFKRCLEEGAEEFIVKPVKPSDLKRLKDYLVGKKVVEQVGEGIQAQSCKRKLPSSPLSPSPSSSSLLPCNDLDVIPPASSSSSQPPQKLARLDSQSATVDSWHSSPSSSLSLFLSLQF